jgi:oligopeptide/dipeptide ABC transporter ATP-binding protein
VTIAGASYNYETVKIRNLSLSADRGEVDILRDIDLDLRAGEILGLVGESGAGKTLLMKSLAGLLPPVGGFDPEGHLQVPGGSIDLSGEDARPIRIAMIFQDPKQYLNPGLRVVQLLREILRYSPLFGNTSALSLLEKVSLPSDQRFLRSFPHELSGGMQQRLVIAAVLAADPDVIIADEALTALDVATAGEILELFRRTIEGSRRSMVYISHDLKTVEHLAHRVAVLYAGRLVELASSRDFFAAPRHPYSRDLMLSHPSLRDRGGMLPEIPGDIPPAGKFFPGCPYAPRCGRADADCVRALPPPVGEGDLMYRCFHPLKVSSVSSPPELGKESPDE